MSSIQRRWSLPSLAACAALAWLPAPALAADFFAGKTVKLIVGMPPGGGVDAYGRLLQRHIVKYLSGTPTIVAQNMPGAGSLTSVRSLTTSPDDATTIVTFSSTLLPDSILNPEQTKIDFRDFKFVGNISEDTRVCYVRSAWGPSTIADLRAREFIFGATKASAPEANMIKNLLGLKMKVVVGYAGAADKRLALEKGEVDADCAGWTSLPGHWKNEGFIKTFIRISPALLPGMDPAVPYGGDLMKSEDEKRIYDFLTASTRLGRLFLVKGKVPADQLDQLRAAFDKTMLDKEFLAEAQKMDLTVTPTKGADVDRQIAEMYATPPALIARAKKMTEGG